MRVAILTISDRAAAGERPDQSGPVLRSIVQRHSWEVTREQVVSDNPDEIKSALMEWADEDLADVILTTGGTGFSPRDITPEATRDVCDRTAPGLAEAMRAASLRITSHAMLSRAAAGIRKKAIIINLPGSPKGAKENLEVVLPVLEHAVNLIQNPEEAEGGHRAADQRKSV
ncbi:MAG: MogA/MoaB family molybdenum cofactor biosynthesis protein [Anaerolineales bacterium]